MDKKLLTSADLKNPWIEAFKTGKVIDMNGGEHNYSEADLQDLNEGIQKQLAGGYKPPLVKGHPKLDEPRFASVIDSKIENGVVKLKIDEVNPDFAEEVKKGGWKYVSAAVYSNLKKGLRHIGALGAIGPAMKGMQELCFGEGQFADIDKDEKEIILFASNYDWDKVIPLSAFEKLVYRLESLGSFFRSQREQLIEQKGVEKANLVLPEWQVKELEGIKDVLKDSNNFPKTVSPTKSGSAAPAFGEESENQESGESPSTEPTGTDLEGNSKKVTPILDIKPDEQMKQENAALKAELARIQSESIAAKKKAEGAAFSSRLDLMIGEGRLNSNLKDDFLAMFAMVQEVPVNEEGFAFSENEENKIKPVELINTMLDKMPQIVAFGELSVGVAGNTKTYAQRLREYKESQEQLGRHISFAEAASEIQ